MQNWYKLDNAGKLYAAIKSKTNTSVYRLSLVLNEEVDQTFLQKALNKIGPRFPLFFVRLKKGVFWNYLEKSDNVVSAKEDHTYPGSTMFTESGDDSLLRVLYYENRVSLEFFHSLADGYGASRFFQSLIFYYINYKYDLNLSDEGMILLAESPVNKSESEDSFNKYSREVYYEPINSKRAFSLKGTRFIKDGHNVLSAVVNVNDIKKVSKKYGATINEYLTALLLFSIYKTENFYNKKNDPIVVSVPVNLRRIFPSETLRNFFSTVNVGIKFDRDYSFTEIIQVVKDTMKYKTSKIYLQNTICSNVAFEEMITAKFVPLFIKKWFIKYGFNTFGDSKKTITLTNTGIFTMPEKFNKYIKLSETNLYTTTMSPVGVAISTYSDKMTISFTRSIMEKDFIKFFITYLSKEEDLDVLVYSNEWGE